MVTTRVKTITTKFQLVDFKLSYNLLLGRPWLYDMNIVPSIVHGIFKFEYQAKVHIVLSDMEPYAFYNVADFKYFTIICP